MVKQEMGTQQLLDALTDHLALYHRKTAQAAQKEGTLKGSLKDKALQWFRSLSLDQRRSILTICDKSWVAIVLQMHRRLAKEGRGFFLVLPDVHEGEPLPVNPAFHSSPASSSNKPEQKAEEPRKAKKSFKARKKPTSSASSSSMKTICAEESAISLPGLCFRKAKGLLARLDEEHEAEELLCSNLDLFGSVERRVGSLSSLDTFSISEDLLSTVDQFIATMNTITCGKFLSSIGVVSQDSPWEELPWLKSMGYYTMGAFVANKVELAMQLAWLQDEGTHRPPRNLCKELRKTGVLAKAHKPDVAAITVLKRYRSFKEWWTTLREDSRSNMLRLAVARAAKMEVSQATRASDSTTNLGSSLGRSQVLSGVQFPGEACVWSITEGSLSGPYVAGLVVLQSLMSSPLCNALSQHADASPTQNYKWLSCSCLSMAGTLPGNIMRWVSCLLQEIMVKSLELDLLKSEVSAGQPPQSMVRKESRRKKNRISGQNHGKSNSRIEEKPKNAVFCGNTREEQHEGTEVHKTEKFKISKKKKHSRDILKDRNEAPSAMTSKEQKIRPVFKLREERKLNFVSVSCEETLHEKAHDSSSANCNSQELLEPSDHCLSTSNSYSWHIESSEGESRIVGDLESSKTESSVNNANSYDPDMHGSGKLEKDLSSNGSGKCEKDLSSKAIDEVVTFKENSLLMPSKSATTSCSTGDVCCVKDVSSGAENASMLMQTVDLDERSLTIKVKEVHCLSSSIDNFSHTPCVSRSSFSSHTSQESCSEGLRSHTMNSKSSTFGLYPPHEWPGTFQVCFPRGRSHVISPATERLHLDVGRNWQQRLQASFIALRNPIVKHQLNSKRCSNVPNTLKSSDCSPLFPPGYAPSRSYPFGFREETGICSLPQPAFPLPFVGTELSVLARAQEELKYDDKTPDDTDYDDSNYFSGDVEDCERGIISEEESDRQLLDLEAHGEGDYNQYFGGGVMFWNTADYAGTGYSRPPSLSSEDSSWARHEADLSVVLDDIMGFPPKPGQYATVAPPGMLSTSPPPATYHPGFEHNPGNTTSRVGLPMSGNEFGKFSPLPSVSAMKPEDEKVASSSNVIEVGSLDGTVPDIVSIPVLRPIVVVRDTSHISQVSKSESLGHHEARSPHVPRRRRDVPLQRRPPSPVLRCVPPSPPPPPPSPVSGFGKRKGVTTARSGSSSPRRWGLINAHHKEEQNVPFVSFEALESALGKRNLRDKASMHPISGPLLRERLFVIPPLAVEKDHPDIALPMQTTILFNSNPSLQPAISRLHGVLHKEIEAFCKQVAAENLLRKPSISTAVDKVAHAMQVLWPRSRLKVFGSTATGLALPCSDVDLVVCLPPVRNLEPIKEAGILEGRNGIKETCLQHAARYLADQDWVKSDTLKTIENTTIPIIMLVAQVSSHLSSMPDVGDHLNDFHTTKEKESSSEEERGPWGGSADREFVRLDISFEAPSHTGVRTAELVRELTTQFPAITPLALVLKQFLTDRSLDQPYTGGLSSYCLVILITRFLQHQHHLGWPFQQNLGSLLMDFLHFFGCVFDPRRMGICIRGGGMYASRDRGHCIDPLHIEDPLYRSNNVGRNCFRILQCVKAFADAYSYVEKTLVEFGDDTSKVERLKVLSNILPSVQRLDLLSDLK